MTAERLDRFMARANAMYYATHNPFTDFTTAPEISQVFGEILGAWTAVAWQHMGRPDPVLLVEAGPGRGTLMADMLRTVRRVMPDYAAAVRAHMIETSLPLRAAQRASLAPWTAEAVWHDSLDQVPAGPMVLVANEFLDALPIRQFVRRGGGWAERYVLDGAFVEAATTERPPETGVADGQVKEINQPAQDFVRSVAERVRRDKGVALFVDYGEAGIQGGESLQAIADGRQVNPLSPAGSADLTALVDFLDMADTAQAAGAWTQGPVDQGPLLSSLGLFERTEALAGQRPADQAERLRSAALRLTDPAGMGTLFKLMAVVFPGCPPLPGLGRA